MLNNLITNKLGVQIIALLVIFLFSSCASSKNVTPQNEGELIITQQKLECMGLCPVYQISIYSDGKVEFVGEKNVPKNGTINFVLSNDDLQELVSSFDGIDFFSLQKSYTKDISDGSTTYISYKKGVNDLKIMDYYGGPKKLKDLEAKVQSMVYKYLNK